MIPPPLEAMVRVSDAPLAYLQAVGVGMGVAVGNYMRNSNVGISVRRYLGEQAEVKRDGFLQVFKEGYRLALESYGYQ